jgi:hypothetical protein
MRNIDVEYVPNFFYESLCNLCGGAYFVIEGEDKYENITRWFLDSPLSKIHEPPTEDEVLKEAKRLKEEWESKKYQRDRKKSYPSIEDQLDMLYHLGYDGWKKEINKIKENFPKS